jgi:hypothetical protein
MRTINNAARKKHGICFAVELEGPDPGAFKDGLRILNNNTIRFWAFT